MNVARGLSLAVSMLFALACAGAPQGAERQVPMSGNASGTAATAPNTATAATAANTAIAPIDHVILGIADLQKGIADLERATGVRAEYGGAHLGRGTHNALLALGDRHYLEIIALNPDDPADAGEMKDLRTLPALTPIGWAVRSDDLAALQRGLREHGLKAGEIRPGSRTRPDGSKLSWSTLGVESGSPLMPFFIQWGSDTAHPSTTSPGGCRLASFFLEDPAPDTARHDLEAAGLHIEVREGPQQRLHLALACPQGTVEFP
jgi:hypothetical protein